MTKKLRVGPKQLRALRFIVRCKGLIFYGWHGFDNTVKAEILRLAARHIVEVNEFKQFRLRDCFLTSRILKVNGITV